MKKAFLKTAFVISIGAMALPAFAANFSPENIPVSATGQIVINPNEPGVFSSIACNIALSGSVNGSGNVIFSSGTVSGATGCSSIKVVTTAANLVPVSTSQVDYALGLVDEPSPLRILFACQVTTTQPAEWNNTTSQVIFNNSPDGSCTLSGALTISPSITIQ